jgi:hypothetical protein
MRKLDVCTDSYKSKPNYSKEKARNIRDVKLESQQFFE